MEELILPNIISGDYWPGINEISFKLNNQDVSLTNAKVIMNIKLKLYSIDLDIMFRIVLLKVKL